MYTENTENTENQNSKKKKQTKKKKRNHYNKNIGCPKKSYPIEVKEKVLRKRKLT